MSPAALTQKPFSSLVFRSSSIGSETKAIKYHLKYHGQSRQAAFRWSPEGIPPPPPDQNSHQLRLTGLRGVRGQGRAAGVGQLSLSRVCLTRLRPPQETHHTLTVNLTTLRVWCYACRKEVFLERKLGPRSPASPCRPLPRPAQHSPQVFSIPLGV